MRLGEVEIARIVSGGQTGADRAALDIAIELGLPYGGWCPAGGLAEDLPTPPGLLDAYPLLSEATSADPALRTRLNVRDSDATLVVRAPGTDSPGTELTLAIAEELGRPLLVTEGDPTDVRRWLTQLPADGRPITLNVAGPRESNQPGIYRATRALLKMVLTWG
jgi:hypothetical protein